jgi:hypothetical protein
MSSFDYDKLTLETIRAVFDKLGGPSGAARFLAGEMTLVQSNAEPPPLDFLVCVDRSQKPVYPDTIQKLMHPELELDGPTEYNLLTEVEQWLHDDQKRGVAQGTTIYTFLCKNNALRSCLNLQDGLAIARKGISVFRGLYAGKSVFLWGTVVQSLDTKLRVAYLCEEEGGRDVVIKWRWLGDDCRIESPALRFKAQQARLDLVPALL